MNTGHRRVYIPCGMVVLNSLLLLSGSFLVIQLCVTVHRSGEGGVIRWELSVELEMYFS